MLFVVACGCMLLLMIFRVCGCCDCEYCILVAPVGVVTAFPDCVVVVMLIATLVAIDAMCCCCYYAATIY